MTLPPTVVGDGVGVGVGDAVGDTVGVGVGLAVGDAEGVGVGVGVAEGPLDGLGVGTPNAGALPTEALPPPHPPDTTAMPKTNDPISSGAATATPFFFRENNFLSFVRQMCRATVRRLSGNFLHSQTKSPWLAAA